MSSQNNTHWDSNPPTDFSCLADGLVLDWFRDQFPAWQMGSDPKQPEASLSLLSAQLPDTRIGPSGMVHFKSINDPLWSQGDLATLRSGFPWILLVLNPFERFYEIDPSIDELSAGTSRLVIWRPDRPTPEESASLRLNFLVKPAASNSLDPANGYFSGPSAAQIPWALYVQRGLLIIQGTRQPIQLNSVGSGLSRHVADCLEKQAAAGGAREQVPQGVAEEQAVHWSALLCGQEITSGNSLFAGESQAIAWSAAHLANGVAILSEGMISLPEPFMTTRFREEVRWFESAGERTCQALRALERRETAFVSCMAQIVQVFNGNEARLIRWRKIAEGRPGFLSWLPAFERSHAYLAGSYPTTDPEVEEIRSRLQSACAEPQRFFDPLAREAFQRDFDDFKTGYIEYYRWAHEDKLQIVSNQERMKSKVDPAALRNLELLSDLNISDKRHINRVRALGKFLHANQCDMPVGEILVRQPRCCCNFNPGGSGLLMQAVPRMNEAILEGVSHFRGLLRARRMEIIRELKNLNADDPRMKEIVALLSQGPMIPLQPPSIDFLGAVIRNNPGLFG